MCGSNDRSDGRQFMRPEQARAPLVHKPCYLSPEGGLSVELEICSSRIGRSNEYVETAFSLLTNRQQGFDRIATEIWVHRDRIAQVSFIRMERTAKECPSIGSSRARNIATLDVSDDEKSRFMCCGYDCFPSSRSVCTPFFEEGRLKLHGTDAIAREFNESQAELGYCESALGSRGTLTSSNTEILREEFDVGVDSKDARVSSSTNGFIQRVGKVQQTSPRFPAFDDGVGIEGVLVDTRSNSSSARFPRRRRRKMARVSPRTSLR
jgi:hypothetical protein